MSIMDCEDLLMPSMPCMQVYFDMNVDGQSQGRIVVQLFDDVPIGSRRFSDLAEGHEGISYQLSKVDAIAPVCMLSASVHQHVFFITPPNLPHLQGSLTLP